MNLGFTGTSKHVPLTQEQALEVLVGSMDALTLVDVAHHGDCVGADAAFDAVCQRLGIERHAHPGTDDRGESPYRAHRAADVIHEPLPYLTRNLVIVALSDLLIACPDGPERQRSGTWSTVRAARHAGVPIHIVWPNGVVE